MSRYHIADATCALAGLYYHYVYILYTGPAHQRHHNPVDWGNHCLYSFAHSAHIHAGEPFIEFELQNLWSVPAVTTIHDDFG